MLLTTHIKLYVSLLTVILMFILPSGITGATLWVLPPHKWNPELLKLAEARNFITDHPLETLKIQQPR
jgi:hypothetical protein